MNIFYLANDLKNGALIGTGTAGLGGLEAAN